MSIKEFVISAWKQYAADGGDFDGYIMPHTNSGTEACHELVERGVLAVEGVYYNGEDQYTRFEILK